MTLPSSIDLDAPIRDAAPGDATAAQSVLKTLAQAWLALNTRINAGGLTADLEESLNDDLYDIEEEIVAAPANSLADCLVKFRVLFLIKPPEVQYVDEMLIASIHEDLERLAKGGAA